MRFEVSMAVKIKCWPSGFSHHVILVVLTNILGKPITWSWRQYVPLKHQLIPPIVHDVKSQMISYYKWNELRVYLWAFVLMMMSYQEVTQTHL